MIKKYFLIAYRVRGCCRRVVAPKPMIQKVDDEFHHLIYY